MKDKIKDLLAVLDMPEEEQKAWIGEYCNKEKIDNTTLVSHPDYGEDYETEISLADLAFRLRDEAGKTPDYNGSNRRAKQQIFSKVTRVKMEMDDTTIILWWVWNAKPIHWIIAALIAKELAKVKDDDETNKT